ncbi:MAG: alpha/beta hydrolase [Leptolinea sp.]|nr:alpha/beta hydrolase [Leptolinea sp.]
MNINDLFYLDTAPENAPVVFLIHGLGTEASSWTYQMEALKEAGFRPIAPDLPGFGLSTYHGEHWTIQEAAEMISALADRMDLKTFHVAGISMGGTIVLQMALDCPERIASLILINTFACLRPKSWNEWFYLFRRYLRARFRGAGSQAELTATRVFPRPDQEELRRELVKHIQQTDPYVYRQAMRELGSFDVRRQLGRINKPTLVISGENDTTVPLANQHDLVTGIPGCRQVFIPEAGHGAIIDRPDLVNQSILEFLKQHSI